MEFFEAVRRRRSTRKYEAAPVPSEVIERALDAALLAPSSSNMQTTEFYWVRDERRQHMLKRACLDQGAARTAPELIVVVADPSLWKRNNEALREIHKSGPGARHMLDYYQKLMPFVYGWQILAPVKFLLMNTVGLFRPMARMPWNRPQVREIAVKSAALACENFMLAIAAQGYDTCPMEGFDEVRVKRALDLTWRWNAAIVMVISVGLRTERGIWGNQIRLPREWFVKKL